MHIVLFGWMVTEKEAIDCWIFVFLNLVLYSFQLVNQLSNLDCYLELDSLLLLYVYCVFMWWSQLSKIKIKT